MALPIDITKFKKNLSKASQISIGFNDPKTWIDTGCYALNYFISNKFRNGGIPLEGKICMFAGDSGSGKSYIATANITKWCQNNNVFPIVIDTENALDESWLNKLGVKTDENNGDMLKLQIATVDDCAATIGEIIENYKEKNKDVPKADKPKMAIILDGLGMLITNNQEKQFMEGDQKGDMGIKAKQVTALLRVLMSKIATLPIGVILTNHVYNSQDKYTPDQIAGGMMVEFSTSVLIQLNKWMLKEDEDGKETKEVTGIRSTVVVRKSRYAKPFEKVRINIPYERGMDPYSGLFELFEKKNLFERAGAWYSYTSPATGEVFKRQGSSTSKWKDVLDHIMDIWETHYEKPETENHLGFDETGVEAENIATDLDEVTAIQSEIEEKMTKRKIK